MSPREMFSLAGLMALALVLRVLWGARAGLWQDEMIFVSILADARRTPWQTMLRYWDHVLSMAQLPLAGVLQNAWLRGLLDAGVSEPMYRADLMRWPPAILGALAVPGMLLAARRLLPRAAAWVSAIWMTAFFFPIFYSREVYCYAHVIFFASWGVYGWLCVLETGRKRHVALTALCLAGMGLSHLGGYLAAGAWCAATGARWLWSLARRESSAAARVFWRATLATGTGLLPGLPFFLRFVFKNTAHTGGNNPTAAIPAILHDVTSKLFWGDRGPWPWLAWALLAAGAWALARRASARARLTVAVGALGALALAVATHRSQYLSARYFAPLLPFYYLLAAAGLGRLCVIFSRGRPRVAARICGGIAGISVLVHLLIFLPPYYRLTEKSVDYAAPSRWLAENMPPGTPFILASGYEYRYIGGYYPLPNLVPMCPYVHGPGPEEERRLRDLQEEAMRRFPLSAHLITDNADDDRLLRAGRHYARFVTQTNSALRQLLRYGIYPSYGLPESDRLFVGHIFYNTAEDVRAAERARGEAALMHYPGWKIVGLPRSPQENLYFRTPNGPDSALRLENLTGHSVTGRVALTVGFLPAQGGPAADQTLVWRAAAGEVARIRLPAGQIRPLETSLLVVPPAGLDLRPAFDRPAGMIAARPVLLLHDAAFRVE